MDHNTKKTTWVRPEAKAEPPQTPSHPTASGRAQQACCFETQCVLLTLVLHMLSYYEFCCMGCWRMVHDSVHSVMQLSVTSHCVMEHSASVTFDDEMMNMTCASVAPTPAARQVNDDMDMMTMFMLITSHSNTSKEGNSFAPLMIMV